MSLPAPAPHEAPDPPAEADLTRTLLAMLTERDPASSLCPSEVARRLRPEDWRPLMPAVRAAAGRLVDAGRLRVTQGQADADPRTARGPIRLRRPPQPPGVDAV